MFLDRAEDLAELRSRWGPSPQVYLLWGRRRVGKSALIREFARDRDAILYQAVTGTATDQLALLTRRIRAWRDDPVLAAAPLSNWDQAFAYLERLGRERKAAGEPLLVAFDEFQYLDESDPTITSRLQEFLETVKHEDLPLFLIVAGSAISFFEERVLLGKIFGRRTAGGLLSPLPYRDAMTFFGDWPAEDRIRGWGILGGVPYYLEQFDPTRSLAWNVQERMLRRNQVLFNEAELLLRDELRDAPTYQSVIAAIADGESKVTDIGNRTRIAPSSLSSILGRLQRLHLVERSVPFGDDVRTSKRGLWSIADNYLAFWFRFVRPNIVEIEAGRGDRVWQDEIEPALDAFVSRPAFERLCREYVRGVLGRDERFPVRGDVAAWWGQARTQTPDGPRSEQREVDIVVGHGRQVTLVGEVKWSQGDLDLDALAQLRSVAAVVPGVTGATRLALFARGGFTDGLRAVAEQESILLISAAEMVAEGSSVNVNP